MNHVRSALVLAALSADAGDVFDPIAYAASLLFIVAAGALRWFRRGELPASIQSPTFRQD
jgi:hypothetical protein